MKGVFRKLPDGAWSAVLPTERRDLCGQYVEMELRDGSATTVKLGELAFENFGETHYRILQRCKCGAEHSDAPWPGFPKSLCWRCARKRLQEQCRAEQEQEAREYAEWLAIPLDHEIEVEHEPLKLEWLDDLDDR